MPPSLPSRFVVTLVVGALVVAGLSHCEKSDTALLTVRTGEIAIPDDLPEIIDFNKHIRPVLNANCTACHGGVKAASGLSFLFREESIVQGDSGNWAIKPGHPQESEVLARIIHSDDPMPPSDHGEMLSPREVAMIAKWIAQGAEWIEHWAYVPPVKPAVPAATSDWTMSPIDHFILAKLSERGMTPNPPAAPSVILRRMSLDLIGLPPTVDERSKFIQAYQNDPQQAINDAADRLLASPHFGERWASMWMDLSRYADTMGYEKDSHRNVWPYRDYLIKSFNADKPYNEFLTEQLAGDLLPNATAEDLVATIFHRNTQTNNEGGTDDEEFRIAAVIDRVNTTWSIAQGTSFGCVQCHSHPYDPIRHEEYFTFMAFYNNTADNDDNDYPHAQIPADKKAADESVRLQQELIELKHQRDHAARELAKTSNWMPIKVIDTTVSGTGKLVDSQVNSEPTLVAEGTIPSKSQFVVNFKPQANQLTALRITSPLTEEMQSKAHVGFALSQLTLEKVDAAGAATPVELNMAASTFNRSDGDVSNVLNDSPKGWNLYPYQFQTQDLYLSLTKPLQLADGDTLRATLFHKRGTDRTDGHTKRFRIKTSNDQRWTNAPSDESRLATNAKIDAHQNRIEELGGTKIPVTIERPSAAQRGTHLFVGGNWMTLGEQVDPGVPGVMNELKVADNNQPANRLDMANWMTARDNPLTARVLVNRLWHELFGRGIVATLGDFGTQGEMPTHPKLLDWLSIRFMDEHQWHIKPLLKDIVTSATYQQSAVASKEDHLADHYNEWLARGPRNRLTAEMVRDQALAVAGLLSDKMFGPSVMPPQPEGVWQTVYSGAKWKTSTGEDRYRRAVYTYWRRTSPYPSMITFDAPSREFCVTERTPTNTPLHALITLNDPVYLEASQTIAQNIIASGNIQSGINNTYQRITGDQAPAATISELTSLYNDALTDFNANPEDAKKLSETPQLAAATIVASVILNLDQVITK